MVSLLIIRGYAKAGVQWAILLTLYVFFSFTKLKCLNMEGPVAAWDSVQAEIILMEDTSLCMRGVMVLMMDETYLYISK